MWHMDCGFVVAEFIFISGDVNILTPSPLSYEKIVMIFSMGICFSPSIRQMVVLIGQKKISDVIPKSIVNLNLTYMTSFVLQ